MSHYICSLEQSGREALIFCLCDTRSMQKNLQMYFASESKSTDYVNSLKWGDSAMKSTDMGLRVSIRKNGAGPHVLEDFNVPVKYYLMSLIGRGLTFRTQTIRWIFMWNVIPAWSRDIARIQLPCKVMLGRLRHSIRVHAYNFIECEIYQSEATSNIHCMGYPIAYTIKKN